jgi:hypothetical protein
MDQDGANQRYLTDGSNLALTPRISPDGRRIAYLAFRNGPPRIMVKEIDTGREGALGDFPGITFAPRFSPDGGTLLITRAQNGNSEIMPGTSPAACEPAHRQRRHRHLALLLARRRPDRLQLRPWRQPAALRHGPGRRRARRSATAPAATAPRLGRHAAT